MKSGDYAWGAIVAGVLAYELVAKDDLLSYAADRYRENHKWPIRVALLAVGCHLGGVLPPRLDVFNPANPLHKAVRNTAWIAHRLTARERLL